MRREELFSEAERANHLGMQERGRSVRARPRIPEHAGEPVEDEIRALADNKSFKGPDNEDYTRSIANHRQDFMRRFFK